MLKPMPFSIWLSGSPAADRPRLLCTLYALGSLLLLLAISALMGAKPM